MLDDDALRAADGGFELDVHLNWYRSLPLSCVQTLELAVDGEAVAREQISFVLDGREHALDELAGRWDLDWFVLDAATLRVRGATPIRAGEQAEVTVRLGSRIPYLLTGPSQAVEYVSERSKTLVAQ
jgi:hypothetical protein